jgi:hypothetical protein
MSVVLLCLALAPGGCGRATNAIAHLARDTRTATERFARDSEEAAQSRERRNDPYLANLRHRPPVRFAERYEARELPDGYEVYDTQEHAIVRFGSQTQTGLSFRQAQDAIQALQGDDTKY